jgi:hypothetical protein
LPPVCPLRKNRRLPAELGMVVKLTKMNLNHSAVVKSIGLLQIAVNAGN